MKLDTAFDIGMHVNYILYGKPEIGEITRWEILASNEFTATVVTYKVCNVTNMDNCVFVTEDRLVDINQLNTKV